jgi:hypothetical protein
VLPVLVAISQFEHWESKKLFSKLGKSAAQTPVHLNAIYGDKGLKNPVTRFVFFTYPFYYKL